MAIKKQSDKKYNGYAFALIYFWARNSNLKDKNVTVTDGQIRKTTITIKANNITN